MMPLFRRLTALLAFLTLLFAFSAPAFAMCCSCTGSDPTKKICLTTSKGTCDTIKTDYSTNPAMGSVTCSQSVPDAQCKTVSDGGLCAQVADAAGYAPAGSAGSDVPPLIAPDLQVKIPGLIFTTKATDDKGNFSVAFLAQYIAAASRYLVGISVIAAAVMLVYGGFRYVMGSTAGSVDTAKTIIKDAIIGLILVFSSYTILQTISPSTTTLQALGITNIKPEYQQQENVTDPSIDPYKPPSPENNTPTGKDAFLPPTANDQQGFTPIPTQGESVPQPLSVKAYHQYDRPWGLTAYGPIPLVCTKNGMVTSTDSSVDDNGNPCCTAYVYSACGATSLAILFTAAGVPTTPDKTGELLTQLNLRKCNQGTQMDPALINGANTGVTITAVTKGKGDDAMKNVAAALRKGQPVMFLCAGCIGKTSTDKDKAYAGHYMVLTGVDEKALIFTVHDVGNPNPRGIVNISQDQLRTHATGFWVASKTP